ncbi:UDP-N-acetyl-D-glucosamine dehydrogenase [Methylopila capsulata]|uniref:UDP-N-acetyl-D-glucosamine dehydrogenase n=1 Tax=Methylopila capsulata TaxID=61654 RepID=A0A9W6MT18_9HYPH|nr:nucleotide sugar dehydrogenase [Methylopila capsulata]MBM7853432.1 UDP-N-acetyl-D-glucosamine dehydrogenase [Methylopila capsulata]GLK57355.1 UDP-N-acetyl-D-glucosamine dehydrogenase [Methylopila capsulata]
MTAADPFASLLSRIVSRTATAGVVGLGYVGLPLALAIVRAGFFVKGFDIDADKVSQLEAGQSYLGTVQPAHVADAMAIGRLQPTADFALLADCDVVIICVPTPLTRHREPDLRFIEETGREIALRLRPGQLVALESTTYPGTTDEVLRPLLETSGLRCGVDFYLGFSPEREDPGNPQFETVTIPKVVAGDGAQALELMTAFYAAVVKQVVPVSTNATAEASKITENIFRAVNIALVNELKVVFDAMGINIWEVIDAAKTKPFGYMPFYPGPGLGGHCIPIDPFYLTWKSREFGLPTRFIELAGEINSAMPRHVVERLAETLDRRRGVALSRAKVLVIGLAYKKNVSDVRESPSFRLIELIEERGGATAFHDPHVSEVPPTREHAALAGRRSVALDADTLKTFDAVLISTDHDAVDYELIAREAHLVIDTRNAIARRGLSTQNTVMA